jgi:hypothetical protein
LLNPQKIYVTRIFVSTKGKWKNQNKQSGMEKIS